MKIVFDCENEHIESELWTVPTLTIENNV